MTFAKFYEENKSNIEALLIDIDGTVCVGRDAIGESAKFLETLRNDNKPFLLLTNDCSRSIVQKSAMLACANVSVNENEIVSCADAFKSLLWQKNCQGKKFFSMKKLGNPCFAKEAKLEVTYDLEELFECDGVISSEGDFDWHNTLEAVLTFFIHHPEKLFLVPNPDSIYPMKGGGFFGIGAGGIARMVVNLAKERGVHIEPIYLGKPYISIYEYAFELLAQKMNKDVKDLNFEKIYAIGDSLSSDIAGANNAKLTSVLVLSGITTLKNVDNEEDSKRKPKLIFNTIA